MPAGTQRFRLSVGFVFFLFSTLQRPLVSSLFLAFSPFSLCPLDFFFSLRPTIFYAFMLLLYLFSFPHVLGPSTLRFFRLFIPPAIFTSRFFSNKPRIVPISWLFPATSHKFLPLFSVHTPFPIFFGFAHPPLHTTATCSRIYIHCFYPPIVFTPVASCPHSFRSRISPHFAYIRTFFACPPRSLSPAPSPTSPPTCRTQLRSWLRCFDIWIPKVAHLSLLFLVFFSYFLLFFFFPFLFFLFHA